MKWETPQEPNENLLKEGFIGFWMRQFYYAFLRNDKNHERITTTTTSYTATDKDCVILCDCTGGSLTVTLPSQSGLGFNKKYIIRKTDASANTVSLAASDSATFKTSVTLPLASQYATITVIADGTDWQGY